MGTSKGWKKMRAGDVTLEQLATYFQVSNRAEGKSPATIRWSDQNIGLFVRFLNERGCSTPGEDDAPACGVAAFSLYNLRTLAVSQNDFIETGKMHAPVAAHLRAKREPEGAVGLRVAACRAKLELD